MTATLQTILLVAGGLWGLAALAFVLALALAASRHSPEVRSPRQGKAQERESVPGKHEPVEQMRSV